MLLRSSLLCNPGVAPRRMRSICDQVFTNNNAQMTPCEQPRIYQYYLGMMSGSVVASTTTRSNAIHQTRTCLKCVRGAWYHPQQTRRTTLLRNINSSVAAAQCIWGDVVWPFLQIESRFSQAPSPRMHAPTTASSFPRLPNGIPEEKGGTDRNK